MLGFMLMSMALMTPFESSRQSIRIGALVRRNCAIRTQCWPNSRSWSLSPAGLLFDATILSTDSYLIDIDPVQRFRLVLSNHENRQLWYTLTNLEVGTEVVNARIYYLVAPATGTLL